jgi:hypothetical protein
MIRGDASGLIAQDVAGALEERRDAVRRRPTVRGTSWAKRGVGIRSAMGTSRERRHARIRQAAMPTYQGDRELPPNFDARRSE